MMNGGMLSIPWAKLHVPAILEAYYPGQLGGTAIVNTLLGKNNPGGKTPVTWYNEDDILDRSIFDMELDSGRGLTHLYFKGEPLWPFGWGLSYTSFTYKWSAPLTGTSLVPITRLAAGGTYSRSCVVTNTGLVTGDAVVLGFVSNSTDPQFPLQKLFDFTRVSLAPGESKTVTLGATADHLSVVDNDGKRWLRPATLVIRVGDMVDPATATASLVGSPVMVEDVGQYL
jgi:beta-glucosidase